MKKTLLFAIFLSFSILIAGCSQNSAENKLQCTNKEDCFVCGDGCISASLAAVTECAVSIPGIACECQNNKCTSIKTQIVGGDKDSHGCIPSAGYSWCEEKQKCLRVWEEECK